jgi:sRNA-binding protein
MNDLTTLTSEQLVSRLRTLEHQVRYPSGWSFDATRLEREWRAASRELDSRPVSEVLG